MKKLKKNHNSKIEQKSNIKINVKSNIETKCSRITIDNRICNEGKFNQLFSLTESIKDYKNTISNYCFDNRLLIISNVKDFLSHYKKEGFNNRYLNAWERQTIYQEITGHYAESLKRYLNKAKNRLNNSSINKDKDRLKSLFMDNVNNIVRLHSKPLPERTEKEKYWYEKLLRTNESLLKTYLSSLIKDWKKENIIHLVLEDLNLLNDKVGYNSYYEHAGIKIKYSRLSRLLRLNQIKNWIASMGEKQEMFTHFINPAYSSKECSNCHYIHDKNRETQELFKCIQCNHELNADHNAGINIKSRLLNKNVRYKLSEDNVYLSARSKSKGNKIYYKKVKEIIEEEYKNLSYQTYSKSKISNSELNINNI